MNRKMVCISSERNRLKIFLVQKISITISYYITNFQQPSLTFDFFMFYFSNYITVHEESENPNHATNVHGESQNSIHTKNVDAKNAKKESKNLSFIILILLFMDSIQKV